MAPREWRHDAEILDGIQDKVALPVRNGKLKLPPGKYTTREKEMLQGCGILPPETVNPLAILVSPNSLALFGAATLAGVYAMYFAACKRYQEHGIKLWGNEEGAKQGSR